VPAAQLCGGGARDSAEEVDPPTDNPDCQSGWWRTVYPVPAMRSRSRLFGIVVPAMMLASVACAAAVPMSSPASTTAAGPAAAASPALPQADDLTLGQNAGKVLVGLTVRPAQPGPNTLLVYVLPLEGPAAAADVPLSLALGGQTISLDSCSRTCRTASVTLVGGEHIEVVAGGAGGGTAAFDLPTLPAQDGTGLLQQVQHRMHQLHTYRVDESLGPATPPLRAAYSFEAPDRMRLSFGDGQTTVWVGPTRYTRDTLSSVWKAEDFGTSLPVPSFVWDIPDSGGTYAGAHIVGADTVEGVETRVLTFFLDLPQTPVWFRLWPDSSGLVRRASMRAQGHFMDHRYTDFDAAVSIEPPL
jgi:hypothetical protein